MATLKGTARTSMRSVAERFHQISFKSLLNYLRVILCPYN